MELADLLGSIRRHWKVSAAIMAVCGLLLGMFLVFQSQVGGPTEYYAARTVNIPARDPKGNRPLNVPGVLVDGQLQIAQSDDIVAAAFERAKLDPNNTDYKVASYTSPTLDTITFTATAPSEATAAELADRYADAFRSERSTIVAAQNTARIASLQVAIEVYSKRLTEIEKQLRSDGVSLPSVVPTPVLEPNDVEAGTSAPTTASPTEIPTPSGASRAVEQLVITRNYLANSIKQNQISLAVSQVDSLTSRSYSTTSKATAPEQVSAGGPSPLIPIGVALGLGLLLAVGVPVLIDRLDHTVKDARSASNLLGAPVLSAIPATTGPATRALARPGSAHDAAFRALAATSVATDRLPRAILVTSPSGNVQDMVAANFAASLASLGLRVALVATNSDQSWFLDDTTNGAQAITLPDLLDKAHRGTLNGEVEHRLANSDLANLMIVPPGDDEELDLPLDGLPPLLAALERADIDVTVIAGPPLLADPNATIFAWATRSVLWAVEIGEMTRKAAQESAERLELAGVDPFGVALVGRET